MKNVKLSILILLVLISGSQKIFSQSVKSGHIKITAWNVQTFFDSENDGTEYSEFVNSKTWGKNSYTKRVQRLADAIKSMDSDVFIMEEIENEKVLMDLSNFLAGNWNSKKDYRYGTFVKCPGSSIGIGVLSRIPLENVRCHNLDLVDEEMPSMRPVLEFSVATGKDEIWFLVNHWKSMSGGKEETECWRNAQEIVVSRIVQEKSMFGKKIVVLGDFNRDLNDFCIENDRVLFRKGKGFDFDGETVSLESCWFLWESEIGSYYFNGNWNRIDHIFYKNLQVLDFKVETEGPWCQSESKIPEKFQLYSENGYSDHLPISCSVKID